MGLALELMSESAYLSFEKVSKIKHEYVCGRIFAMAGTSKKHNKISLNIGFQCRQAARNTNCEVYIADVKLKIAHRESYYYPDVMVGCEEENNDYFIEKPCILVEVTSKSTETTDRREKLSAYKSIESLQTYLIVSQDTRYVEVYQRNQQFWNMTNYTQPHEMIDLPCLKTQISVEQIYESVEILNHQFNSDNEF
jgi:Uma2 family endonuclease